MASLRTDRDRGKRRTRAGLGGAGNDFGIRGFEHAEHRLNHAQMHALDAMYHTHPAVQAARTVLHAQLLSGGLKLMRGGEILQEVAFGAVDSNGVRVRGVTHGWAQHLDEHWLPFARNVIDSFLKWGICPATVRKLATVDNFANAIHELKKDVTGTRPSRRAKSKEQQQLLVPHVPHFGTYELAWVAADDDGYSRQYIVYSKVPAKALRVDDHATVFVRNDPDGNGNVNSPLSTVYDTGSFVSGLVEMAFLSEISRSQPTITTQIRKQDRTSELNAGALFFDTESREVAAAETSEASQLQARALETQAKLCEVINRLQTTADANRPNVGGKSVVQPPDIPPKLFVLPKDHELAPNVQLPQPRGDLESLMRFGVDQFCSALGVPSALIFEGRFSNNAATQLALLNSTVAQLAKATNQVLTYMYTTLYSDDGDQEEPVRLKLQTSPLASTQEVAQLFTAQLVDRESALPMALHALGVQTDEIEAAMHRALEQPATPATPDTFATLDRVGSASRRESEPPESLDGDDRASKRARAHQAAST